MLSPKFQTQPPVSASRIAGEVGEGRSVGTGNSLGDFGAWAGGNSKPWWISGEKDGTHMENHWETNHIRV